MSSRAHEQWTNYFVVNADEYISLFTAHLGLYPDSPGCRKPYINSAAMYYWKIVTGTASPNSNLIQRIRQAIQILYPEQKTARALYR
jgi:hypothetical protein